MIIEENKVPCLAHYHFRAFSKCNYKYYLHIKYQTECIYARKSPAILSHWDFVIYFFFGKNLLFFIRKSLHWLEAVALSKNQRIGLNCFLVRFLLSWFYLKISQEILFISLKPKIKIFKNLAHNHWSTTFNPNEIFSEKINVIHLKILLMNCLYKPYICVDQKFYQ